MFRLKLLGGARLERDGTPIDGPASQRQRLAILAVLSASGGGMSRDRLLSLLWPEGDPAKSRHALSNAIYALRAALGDEAVASAGEELRLDPSVVTADVMEYEEAIGQQDLERAVALYDGPFLAGFSINSVEFERWADGIRDQLAARQSGLLEQLATLATTEGDLVGAAEWWQRYAAQDPHSSRSAVELMRALEAAGDPAAAMKHARIHASLLEHDLQSGPDPAVVRLATEIHDRMQAGETPAPATRVEPRPDRPVPPLDGSQAVRSQGSSRPAGARPSAYALVMTGLVAGIALLALFSMTRSSSPSLREMSTADPTTIRSLAVLPLDNLSEDPEETYFADGMTEILTAELTRLGDLTVVSRTSASRIVGKGLPMTEVARQLGVDGVVEGSVFRSGDQIRVTVQLIHGPTDGHVWAESYEGSTDDAIGLQRRVAKAIARSLEITLSADEQARLSAASALSSEAQEAFFRGIHRTRDFTALSVQAAIEEYHRAVALEPTWAEAAGMLGQSYWILTQPLSALPASEGMPLARQWATRAVALDPDLGIGHSSLGWVSLFYDRDLEAAERFFDRAVETWPRSGVGYNGRSFVSAIRGEPEEAVAQGKRAVAVDRLDLSFRTALAELYYYDRQFDQALSELDRVISMDPRYARAYSVRRWVLEAQELWADAAHALTVDVALSSGAEPVPAPSLDSRESYWRWRVELLTADALDSVADPTLLAWAHAESGDADQALEYLDRAVAAGSGQLVFLGVQPAWDRIRVDPRFVELITRLGIPTV